MLISKTPLRISFVGGGTDNLVNQSFEGNVISTTIDKYVFISLNKKFDKKFRFSYSKTENVKDVMKIKHNMLRETFKHFKLNEPLEITSVADVPSYGSGLGSSSSFLVGLINCINIKYNLKLSKKKIAEKACKIEIEILNKPVGMQDQYIASYGGLNWINFKSKKKIIVKKIELPSKKIEQFNKNLFLIYTNKLRKSETVLKKIKINKNTKALKKLSDLALDFKYELLNGDLNNLGKIMHENWIYKKELSQNTSNHYLDDIYNLGLKSGSLGGKILGAGGGGFMLFYVQEKFKKKFCKNMKNFRLIDFKFSNDGSTTYNI